MRPQHPVPRIAFSVARDHEAADMLVRSLVAEAGTAADSYDWEHPHKLFYDTSAMALMALSERTVDFAILPFISSQGGYVHSVLHEINSLFDVVATRIINLRDTYCLAALAEEVASIEGAGPGLYFSRMEILGAQETERRCASALKGFAAQGAVISIVGEARIANALLARGTALPEGDATSSRLRAVIMPTRLAEMNSRYVILEDNIQERADERWMLVFQRARDETVRLDKYKTTDARTRYFYRRLKAVMAEKRAPAGAGVILRFRRDGDAASIGDVESYLRNYGVRYEVLDLPVRDGHGGPPPRYLDIEFEAEDLTYNPFRRLRGAVANGAMKLAFSRWKSRGAQVVGAMPLDAFRMPAPTPRRWWKEGGDAAVQSFGDTMFIRFSRLLFYAIATLGFIGAGALLLRSIL